MSNTLFLIILLTSTPRMTKSQPFCDNNVTALEANADYIVAAVLPISKRIEGSYIPLSHAIIWAEAIIYATKAISENPNLLPGLTLGYAIRDSCHGDVDAITKHAIDFITDENFYKKKNESALLQAWRCSCRKADETTIAGVIGGSTDETSEIISQIVRTSSLPMTSPSELSDVIEKNRNFVRLLPSHTHTIKALVDFLTKLQWSYISAVAYDDNVGRTDMDTLRNELKQRNACLALEYLFDETTSLDRILTAIDPKRSKTDIVILWSSIDRGLPIVAAAEKRNLSITWITLWEEGPYAQRYLSMQGSFTIEQTQQTNQQFTAYLQTLKLPTVKNPWLKSFWEKVDPTGQYFKPAISMAQKHTNNVLAAVYTIAYGLHEALACNTFLCKNKKLNYTLLTECMRKAQFQLNNRTYRISNPLFGKVYNIRQIQINKEISSPSKTYLRFEDIARFNGETNNVTIHHSSIIWKDGRYPRGVCSRNCRRGEKKIPGATPCCWECLKCPKGSISSNVNQEFCERCLPTQYANNGSSKCLTLENINLQIASTTGEHVLLTLNVVGTICTVFLLIVYLLRWNTPIVKSSNREMSIIQMTVILLLFWVSILHYPTLTKELCIAQNLYFGVLHATLLSLIIIKTYRLLRVFRERRFSRVSKYLQNKYQLTLVLVPIVIFVGYVAVWYQIYDVEIGIESYSSDRTYVMFCKVPGHDSANDIENHVVLFAIISFLIILSLIAGYMAFRARQLPESFNEAQFIFYSMFTSLLIWLLFIFIYLSQKQESKPLAFLTVNTINVLCELLILYGYKIVVMLLYPQLNTKSHFQKLAKNAKVVTYIQDVLDPDDEKRPSKVSVISFDFDTMFRDYNNIKNEQTTAKKSSHFPSTILKRLSTIRRSKPHSMRRQKSRLVDDNTQVQINPAAHMEKDEENQWSDFGGNNQDSTLVHQNYSEKESIVSIHS